MRLHYCCRQHHLHVLLLLYKRGGGLLLRGSSSPAQLHFHFSLLMQSQGGCIWLLAMLLLTRGWDVAEVIYLGLCKHLPGCLCCLPNVLQYGATQHLS
jgi:hypothetical protein